MTKEIDNLDDRHPIERKIVKFVIEKVYLLQSSMKSREELDEIAEQMGLNELFKQLEDRSYILSPKSTD